MADIKTLGQLLKPYVETYSPEPIPRTFTTVETNVVILGDLYSPMGGAPPGSLAADPILYERQLERQLRLPAGKLAVHALTNVALAAMNVRGTVWNPALAAPPPIIQNSLLPALDLPLDGNTESTQLLQRDFVDDALSGDRAGTLVPARDSVRGHKLLATRPTDREPGSLQRAFEKLKNIIPNVRDRNATRPSDDPLVKSSFSNGLLPMAFAGENRFGFTTFPLGGDVKRNVSDDDAYVPLCFTDLRPIGDIYRTVFFRPIITNLAESFAPEWNEAQYFGRVDPVATYMSTGRSISLGFKLVAFGPEDVRTIYQKLNWLTSMVYPEYGQDLTYKSGPVIRMRVGDVINARGPEGGHGLPGIIKSLDFDYSDTLWELKEGYKVPRHVDVALSFTVLHDVPIGRGDEGKFGGLGKLDPKTGFLNVPKKEFDAAGYDNFRSFARKDRLIDYQALNSADGEK